MPDPLRKGGDSFLQISETIEHVPGEPSGQRGTTGADNTEAFMADRQNSLITLVERHSGNSAYSRAFAEESEDAEHFQDPAAA